MWLCILSSRPFEETHENAQWSKVKQMQSMWLRIFSGRQFEDTHAIQKSRKIPVFYFQKSRYRYLSPISVYRYFPVYRRGLVVSFLSLSFCLFIFVFLSSSFCLCLFTWERLHLLSLRYSMLADSMKNAYLPCPFSTCHRNICCTRDMKYQDHSSEKLKRKCHSVKQDCISFLELKSRGNQSLECVCSLSWLLLRWNSN